MSPQYHVRFYVKVGNPSTPIGCAGLNIPFSITHRNIEEEPFPFPIPVTSRIAERNVITHIKSVSLSQSLNTINHICILGHVVAIKPVTTTTTNARAQIRAAANTRSRGMEGSRSFPQSFRLFCVTSQQQEQKQKQQQPEQETSSSTCFLEVDAAVPADPISGTCHCSIYFKAQIGIGNIPIHICL